MIDMIPLLLTATVNPQGMKGANFDPKERVEMYVSALKFYASKGLKVVFAENSGWIRDGLPVSGEWLEVMEKLDNVELVDVSDDLSQNSQIKTCYDQSRGKGYNETILLHKAVLKSRFVQEAGFFFKITGRLKVMNIEKLLKEVSDIDERLAVSGERLRFLADCKDHKVYEWLHMPINGHAGECRYWFASVDFFEKYMWPRYDELNDYEPNICLAEDLMLDVCRKTRGKAGCRDRFKTQARISGKGGHKLGKGWSFFYSTDNDSFALRAKCFIRQCLRWCMPWWRV